MQVTKIMDEQGRIIDPEVSAFAQSLGGGFKKLVDTHPEWTKADLTIATYHIQGYLNSVLISVVLEEMRKKQQLSAKPSLKPTTPE